MYVELYILDNWLMNMLILRLAACFLGLQPKFLRMSVYCGIGAFYALLSLFFPILLHFVFKVVLCLFMALGLKPKCAQDFFIYSGVVFISTLIAGGTAYALAFLFGGKMSGGYIVASLPLRVFIITAAFLTFTPNLIRRVRRYRINSGLELEIIITHKSDTYHLTGFIDTGNKLREPITALPGLLVNCPELLKYAYIPMYTHGAFGSDIIYGFKPDRILISGDEASALVFIAPPFAKFSGAGHKALIPPDAIPLNHNNNMEVVKCKTGSKHLLHGFWQRFSKIMPQKSIISVQAKRFHRH